MQFVKFPTSHNMAVGGSIFSLIRRRLDNFLSEEQLRKDWEYYTRIIKGAMSQQRSNNAIQFGLKLKGKKPFRLSVNDTPLTQHHTEKEAELKHNIGELKTENCIDSETERHSPNY